MHVSFSCPPFGSRCRCLSRLVGSCVSQSSWRPSRVAGKTGQQSSTLAYPGVETAQAQARPVQRSASPSPAPEAQPCRRSTLPSGRRRAGRTAAESQWFPAFQRAIRPPVRPLGPPRHVPARGTNLAVRAPDWLTSRRRLFRGHGPHTSHALGLRLLHGDGGRGA